MFSKTCTYGEFLKADEGIATNILASRLIALEENGLIEKLPHPESKAKILYKLTRKGIDLVPVLIEMSLWAEKYYTISKERKEMLKKAKKDKQRFIEETMEGLAG